MASKPYASRDPDWYDLMAFTDGKWPTIESGEERRKVLEKCSEHLEKIRLKALWKEICPLSYRETDVKQLPDIEKFNEVQNWEYGPKGLLVLGRTRRGKTRSVWKLLERLHFGGRRVIAYGPMDLKLEVARAWRDADTAEDCIRRLRSADVLFMDDLDTIKFTEAVEETIYDIFESRPARGLPVIVTLNKTGSELASRMNACGRGAKIVERMREYCNVVNFG